MLWWSDIEVAKLRTGRAVCPFFYGHTLFFEVRMIVCGLFSSNSDVNFFSFLLKLHVNLTWALSSLMDVAFNHSCLFLWMCPLIILV